MIRPLILLPVLASMMLASCKTPEPFPDTPDPWQSSFRQSIKNEPNSKFTLACQGDRAALHEYFSLSILPLDGMRRQSFDVTIPAIYSYLGRKRFLEALARESPEIQQAVAPHVPYYR
jgi:hypothetical protein